MASLPDFSIVTELPGSPATEPQLARLAQRYRFAAERSAGRRALEVACGAGLGLGWMAERCRLVVGGDCTESLLQSARAHYGARARLVRLDAHDLPFADGAFDAVLLFEAAYYLRDLSRFLVESRRVLSRDGLLVISSVNPEWSGFSPSRLSTTYATVAQLSQLVTNAGFTETECYGGFPTHEGSARDGLIELVRRLAAKFHLIPGTLRARALLKRLVYGPTVSLPPEIRLDDSTQVPPVEPISRGPDRTHQIIYLVASNGPKESSA